MNSAAAKGNASASRARSSVAPEIRSRPNGAGLGASILSVQSQVSTFVPTCGRNSAGRLPSPTTFPWSRMSERPRWRDVLSGRIVEIARAEDLYADPRMPYTAALLSAIPGRGRPARERIVSTATSRAPLAPPSGCPFRTRCWKAGHLRASRARAPRSRAGPLRRLPFRASGPARQCIMIAQPVRHAGVHI